MRRVPGGIRPPVRRIGRGRGLYQTESGETPQQLSRPLPPQRRGAGREPHLHLLDQGGGRRSHQQLDGPQGDAGHSQGEVQGLHARTDPIRDPLQHGSPGLRHRPHRVRDHRLGLCGGQPADHDPHGPEGSGCPG